MATDRTAEPVSGFHWQTWLSGGLSAKTLMPLVWAGLFGIAGSLAAYLIAHGTGIETGFFTREPQSALEGAWYAGWFSQLGGTVWFACAGFLTLTLMLPIGRRDALTQAAAISWMMGLDDVFLLHDAVYPMFGVHEVFVAAFYMLLVCVLLAREWRSIGPAGVIGVVAAAGLWAFSMVFDRLLGDVDRVLEDGSKFTGICIWAGVWLAQCRAVLAERIGEPDGSA